MDYQALYRKYRPKNFDEVVGQKITIQILKNAIENGHISHAYLFYGPRGTGKTSIAKILARTINCLSPKNGIPCEKCENCLASSNPGCPDILEIDAASNNGVDEIRELKDKISFVPSELKYKVYIVDEVHMLSTGAFNALLKTLEEPPAHAIFILATTELQKVPLTIISRCQTLEFKKIDTESMKNKIKEISTKEKISISEDGILEICKYSNGGLRDAIGLLEKAVAFTNSKIDENTIREISGNISDQALEEFLNLYTNKDIDKLLELINKYYNDGVDLIKLSNNLIDFLRNRMINNKTYNQQECNLILNLDKMVSQMEKSENPKIVFEISIINSLVTDDTNQDAHNITKNVISEQKQEPKKQTEPVEKLTNNDLKSIRVGNTLCNPQKEIISHIRNNWNDIKNYAFDEDLGNMSRILSSDILPVAASDTNVIIIAKLEGLAAQVNDDIEKVEDIFNKLFNKQFRVICLSEKEWKQYTEEYKQDKSKFVYIEEKIIEKKEEKKNKSLKDKAKELFDE
jgi:DNA polymerase-3 subunit gamma/tau